MDTITGNLFTSLLGFLYLFIRYRSTTKVKSVLRDDYENSYHNAGLAVIGTLMGSLFFIIIAAFLLAAIFSIAKFGLSTPIK